jgi:hypothetical protein
MCQGHLQPGTHRLVCTQQRALLFVDGEANKLYNYHYLFRFFILATYYMRNPSCSEIFWVDDNTRRVVKTKFIVQVRKSRQQFAKEQYCVRWHQTLVGP